jgi:hypothetical protein
MTIGTQFVRGSNPVWYFVDLVGKQTDGSFYLWTLTNTIPYIPQAVFHDVNGLIPWTDPIEFLANGTLPIDIFFDDTQVYRLEIRQNDGTAPPSQADALIYLVENYIPNGGSGGIQPIGADVITTNQITDPQFSIVNFQSPLVLTAVTNPPSIEIAPDWFLDLSGTGSITVTQIPLNTTFPNPTNAPYALSFLSSGWTNPPVLRQRFYQNGMNWQNKTVATSITARIDGASQNIQVSMVASNNSPVGSVLINAPLTNSFTEFQGNTLVPTFANLNLPPNAYIDYKIILPQNATSYITSVQVTESLAQTNVEYQQDTINRQIDHTFHYYLPQLAYKPIPSYLIGWDFPLNPAQILGANVPVQAIGANTSYYAWDQTILFQTANSGLSVARSLTDGISITAQQAGSFAIIQYLERAQAIELFSAKMAVYLEGSAVDTISGTITLWGTDSTGLPVINSPTYQSLVSAVSATGVVTAGNGSWTKVPRGSFPDATFQLTSTLQTLAFNGWELNDALILTAEYVAIVIAFEAATVGNSVEIDKVGLYAGDIATRPAPKTHDETLRDCERYYEKSYRASDYIGVVTPNVGPVTTFNQMTAPQSSGIPANGAPFATFVLQDSFGFQYRTLKRTPATAGAPTVTLYSPATGAANNVRYFAQGSGAVNQQENPTSGGGNLWANQVIGNKSASYIVTTNSNTSFNATNNATPLVTWITYHYVADARLGVVL